MTSAAWNECQTHYQDVREAKIRDFFVEDPLRFEKFSVEAAGLLFDYSKQHVNVETIRKLTKLAESSQLSSAIRELFSGGRINTTENRPALHTALRDLSSASIMVDGVDVKPEIMDTLNRLERFVDQVRNKERCGATGKPITDVLCLGIGGSDLGPSMVCRALANYRITNIQLHFISNVDGQSLAHALKTLDPTSTLCVINSKTFTTIETLQNAGVVKGWFERHLGNDYAKKHLVGVTANPERARQFGIEDESLFPFWDFIGGRYSIWSSVGLPVALLLGMPQFKAFLAGAHAMDTHFADAPFYQNMPVLMGMIGIWNINFFRHASQAVIPYEDSLEMFPSYLQQLEMESNGKRASRTEGFVPHQTAPVLWGGVGCNSQHAYMQLLHQSDQVIPVDFIMGAQGDPDFSEHHKLLVASCLSQSKALMEGNQKRLASDELMDAKLCLGNRPSTTLMYQKLSPSVLGALIALYEHKVFVQGIVWGINSFDQWGVELGKQLAKGILGHLETQESEVELDGSTKGLIDYFQKNAP